MDERAGVEVEIVRDILAREMPEYELVETGKLEPGRPRARSSSPGDDEPRRFFKSPAIGVLHTHYGELFGGEIAAAAEGLQAVLAGCRQGDLEGAALRLVTVRPRREADGPPLSVIVSVEERMVVGLQT